MTVTISKTHKHKINMGPYEGIEVMATVTLTDIEDENEALDHIDSLLFAAVEPDLKQARKLAIEDSYIHDWTESK